MNLAALKEQLGFVRYYGLVIFVLAGMFYAGHEFAKKRNEILSAKNELLAQSIQNLTNENQLINSQLNVKKVELEVASIANEQAQQTLKNRLNLESELRQQISFYQKVMAPEMMQDGFVIESAEISATASDSNYAIKLMMLQHENIKATIKGTLEVTIFGSLQGKPASYSLDKLQDDPEQKLSFAFKYFEVVETRITLPDGFIPDRLEISTDIYKYKRKRGSYKTQIKWQDALSE